MDNESDNLRNALKRMPAPQPRPGFVDRALRNATATTTTAGEQQTAVPGWFRHFISRWETWTGAVLGAAAAAALTILLLRPVEPTNSPASGITLALHEARDVDVLIDSERALTGATIRIAVTGGVTLNGFENDREISWQTDLERGRNLLSLPLIARSAGKGQLVAVIEHEGRTQRVTVALVVSPEEVSQS